MVSWGWAVPTHADDRPNFLFLLADDLGYGDLECYGRDDIRTPHLNQLARDGVRFTAHYANGAECTPTRAAFLTGRYQQRIGGLECAIGTGNVGRYDDAVRLRATNDLGLPTSEQTIVRLLKDAGYATCISGKWHLGYEQKFAPNLHGFDASLYCIGGGMDYFRYNDNLDWYNLYSNGYAVHRTGYFTDLITDAAIDFLSAQSADKPFFLYVPFTCPHAPYQGPDDEATSPLSGESPLWQQGQAPPETYVAMIERMDACIGRLLKALDARGMRSNTVVIFASDNGGTASARNAPLRGIKGQTFEGGIRVPGIIRFPGVIPAGIESHEPCLTFDFTASIARLAGVRPAADKPFEGIDIIGQVAGTAVPVRRDLYWRKQRGEKIWKAVRRQSLKYVALSTPSGDEEYLFDLAADPAETHDLREMQPDRFRELKTAYDQWEQEVRRNRRGQP
ncbi:MAG: N-acetylgalactosamine-6-sulfatase [Planctomycetota bacterium]|nr:MAG: N-acetylgalactosamine-6-sulfatase [Planctomycetota bacterium]